MPIVNSIIWTDEERKKIVERYNTIYPGDEEPTDKMIRAAASQVLPPERQRQHISPNDPVKRAIYAQIGKPMPIKNQKRSKAMKKSYARRMRKNNKVALEGAQLFAASSNDKQPIATLQSPSKPLVIRIVLDLALNAAATIVRE
jgi:hypothetical protein